MRQFCTVYLFLAGLSVSGCICFSQPDCIGNHTVHVVDENDETISNFRGQLTSTNGQTFDIECQEGTYQSTEDYACAPTGLRIRPVEGPVVLRIESEPPVLIGEETFELTIRERDSTCDCDTFESHTLVVR